MSDFVSQKRCLTCQLPMREFSNVTMKVFCCVTCDMVAMSYYSYKFMTDLITDQHEFVKTYTENYEKLLDIIKFIKIELENNVK